MVQRLNNLLKNTPRLLILGFGKEGHSTYRLLRKLNTEYPVSIADKNPEIAKNAALMADKNLKFYLGHDYLASIVEHDLVIKSPGISIHHLPDNQLKKITSQTDIFLELFSGQIIGITGTKGKSTTASLIFHFLKNNGKNVVLLGNIGIPPFDKLDEIGPETRIVFEMSAHQLEFVHHSPHIAVLLNIFPEHLDHFQKFEDYAEAKKNIYRFQSSGDVLIAEESLKNDAGNSKSASRLFGLHSGLSAYHTGGRFVIDGKSFAINPDANPLEGEHNLKNLMAAILAVQEAGVSPEQALACLPTFKTLPHRLEYVGKFAGVDFYNDSISTVPESAIAALKTLAKTDILILGGYDRGLDYSTLVNFIGKSGVTKVVFLGKAGEKMFDLFAPDQIKGRKLFKVQDLEEALGVVKHEAKKDTICLLSPAAASYDQFHNFEHRGDFFKGLVLKYFS